MQVSVSVSESLHEGEFPLFEAILSSRNYAGIDTLTDTFNNPAVASPATQPSMSPSALPSPSK